MCSKKNTKSEDDDRHPFQVNAGIIELNGKDIFFKFNNTYENRKDFGGLDGIKESQE